MGSVAVIAAIGLLLFGKRPHAGDMADQLATAARTTGAILFTGVLAAAAAVLYLRCTAQHYWSAACTPPFMPAAGRAPPWLASSLVFVRGVQTIRTWGDLTLASV